MDILVWLFCALAVSWFMAHSRASLSSFTLSFAVLMAIGSFFGLISLVAWFMFVLIVLPLNNNTLRVHYISKPVMALLKRIKPQLTRSETEAINASTSWFEADLFRGSPDWQKLHTFPPPRLSAQEQAFLDGPVEQLCAMVNDWHTSHERADLQPQIWQFLKDNKFFAMIIDKQFDGLEFCAYAQSRVLQKLSGVSPVLSATVAAPNALGPTKLLQQYGSKVQKQYYLPRLATGQEIPCFALSSPETGSDVTAIADFGHVCKGVFNGEKVLGMRITWDKRYITLAPVATLIGLAFNLRDPQRLLGEKVHLGITCVLIPANLDGVTTGRRHFPVNVPFQNGPTQGENVFVPLDFIIGGAQMAGKGWSMLADTLAVNRAISLPSTSTGAVKSIALATGAYSRIRCQFNQPIGKLEGIEEALARIGGNAYLMDAVTTMSSGAIDLGEKPSVVAAIAKYHLSEKMRQVSNDAMDIHGGKALCLGPNNYLARIFQSAPIAITVEGANIFNRSKIIYRQGYVRCHPYLLAELQAISNSDGEKSIDDFDHAFFGHIGFAISNVLRSLWFSLSGATTISAPFDDKTRRYYQLITRFSANLAMLSDISLLLFGDDVKRKQRLCARLGDMLSFLFLACACLKRYNDDGRRVEDLPLLQWAVEDCLYQTQQALHSLLSNLANKFVARLLKLIIFPFGRWLTKPSDHTDHLVARILQTPGPIRNRIAQGQYLTRDRDNLMGQLEQTLEDILSCEPVYEKICLALGKKLPFYHFDKMAQQGLDAGAISEQEAQLLRKTEVGRQGIISVDDFSSDELGADKSLFSG